MIIKNRPPLLRECIPSASRRIEPPAGANKSIIFSGGGYFRLFPYPLIKKWTKQSDYVMSYLHPRDFDAEQPVIKELSAFRKFKSYVGLKNAKHKLEKWLTDFEFVDIGTAVEQINWNKVPVVEL